MLRKRIKNYDFYFEMGGGGDTLVFGHSLATDHSLFQNQVRALSDDYQIVNLDLPGFGKTLGSIDKPWTLEGVAEDVIELLTGLKIKKAHFIGLSYGGMVFLRVAMMCTQLCKSLILMNTSAELTNKKNYDQLLQMAKAYDAKAWRVLLEPLSRMMLSGYTQIQNIKLVDYCKQQMVQARTDSSIHACMAVFDRKVLLQEVCRLRLPTLVLTSYEDLALSPIESQNIADAIPGAIFDIVPHAGHLTAIENPDFVTKRIKEFLVTFSDHQST